MYTSQNINRMRRAGHIPHVGEMKNAYKNLVGKPEGKRQPGRPRSEQENNIRIDLRETGWRVVDWMHLAQDRDQLWVLVNAVMDLDVP
jgi:hypothetical protein